MCSVSGFSEPMLRGAEQSGRRNAQVLVPKFFFLAKAEWQEQQGDGHGRGKTVLQNKAREGVRICDY